jgi:hypothetical protein
MVLQNYTNLEEVMPGLCGETHPTSYDANQAMRVKAEEVSEIKVEEDPETSSAFIFVAEEVSEVIMEEDPEPVTFPKIKAGAEVSCMQWCAGTGSHRLMRAGC